MTVRHNSGSMIERMEASARVSRFITEDEDCGRWRIYHFEVDEHHHRMSIARAIGEGGPNREARVARTIPEGEYVSLLRKATPGELEDIASGAVVDAYTDDGPNAEYTPVMSDTPTEIREMNHAFRHARGRVLITGLGLGCLVAGLLSNPDVTEIVVVEIDRDVIALTGKFYAKEPRVTIVNDDAIRFAATYKGPDFDYAWHDIWTHIADRNLEDDSIAEHGISYESMFTNFERFCDHQGAWGYVEALQMRESKDHEHEMYQAWGARFIDPATTDEEREDMLVDFHIRRLLGMAPDAIVPDEIREWADENMDIREGVQVQMMARPNMVAEIGAIVAKGKEPDDPMHRPNEAPEANVA